MSASDVRAEASLFTPSHPLTSLADAGFSETRFRRIVQAVEEALSGRAFPGAALAVGRGAEIVWESGHGRHHWSPEARRVDPEETLFDLASLSKVMATTSAVMLLVEDGLLDLDAPVRQYVPEFSGTYQGQHAPVTVRHLLTHTSGLPDWVDVGGLEPEGARRKALSSPLQAYPGMRVRYSDVGFIVLWEVAAAAAPEPLTLYLDRRVYSPLQMTRTTFAPGTGCAACAPTARFRDQSRLQGIVHDPLARKLGGVTGNAGLFATLHDVARFAAMMAGGGQLGEVRVFQEETVREFVTRIPGADTRALGWDTPSGDTGSGAAGGRLSSASFGHTGFTGTSLWVDAERGTWLVLLSNRTFAPQGPNRMQALRRRLHNLLVDALL